MGPILFLIYINDLPGYVKSSCKIFVDDTKIYAKVGNMTDVKRIQKDIDELVEWSRTWLLNFNAGKCSHACRIVGARNGRANYFMEGTEIQAVSEEKDLGVVVDDKLRFSRHIAAAAAACATGNLDF